MPGGSVNGRTFRESSDSYEKTGIPCGNPKRYESVEVVRMSDHERRKKSTPLAGPVEEIETEGQRQLKNLVKKQLKTRVTIQEQLKQSRDFSGGTAYKATTDELSGLTSLSEYHEVEREDAYILELRQCGLTDDEISLKLQHDNYKPPSKLGKYGTDPQANQDRMQAIERKIQLRHEKLSKSVTFFGQKEISRHEMDLEKTLVQDNKITSGLSTVLLKQGASKSELHPDHPMNHLPEILKSIMPPKGRKNRRKSKASQDNNLDHQTESTEKDIDGEHSSVNISGTNRLEEELSISSGHNSVSNIDSAQVVPDGKQDNVEPTTSTNRRRELCGPVESISEDFILSNRLSIEEIYKLPRFNNYQAGTPSKVLYLKNLSNKVAEEDLVSLFIRFQSPGQDKIVFRLLSGKMKGQAFVTFPDEEKATAALELVNGFELKGKPVIISFGKNKT